MIKTTDFFKRVLSDTPNPLEALVEEYLLTAKPGDDRLHFHEVDLTSSEFRPPGRISPSSIGGCARRAVLSFVKMPSLKRRDTGLERVFRRGKWIHEEWQATFRDMEMVLGPERFKVLGIEERIKLRRLFIRGRLDARVLIDGHLELVVDIKSARDTSYYRMTREGVSKEYIRQIHPYMESKRLRKGMILLDNKNDQSYYKAVPIDFNDKIWDQVVKWCRRVIRSVNERSLPPMDDDCTPTSGMAKNCPFAKWCYKRQDEIEGVAFRKEWDAEQWWKIGMALERRNDKLMEQRKGLTNSS